MKKYLLFSMIVVLASAYANESNSQYVPIKFNTTGTNHITINSVKFINNKSTSHSQRPIVISGANEPNELVFRPGSMSNTAGIDWIKNILSNEDVYFNAYNALCLCDKYPRDTLPDKLGFAVLGTLIINYTSKNINQTSVCPNIILALEYHGTKSYWWLFSNQNNIPDYEPLFYISCSNGDLGWNPDFKTANTFNLVEIP